jgi:DnaJ-class molecular chaperone
MARLQNADARGDWERRKYTMAVGGDGGMGERVNTPDKVPCPVCFGRGEVDSVAVTFVCPDCRGTGLVSSTHLGLIIHG